MKKTLATLAAALAVAVAFASVAEAASGRIVRRGQNGAFAAGSVNGNAYARGWGVRKNADGSTSAASGGAFRLNNGAVGGRASTTTVNPDGSVAHRGGFAASGARGSVNSQGGFTRNADGTVSGGRDTNVTAANGNGYSGSTTYDSTNGLSHSGSCHDASGAAIACPTR